MPRLATQLEVVVLADRKGLDRIARRELTLLRREVRKMLRGVANDGRRVARSVAPIRTTKMKRGIRVRNRSRGPKIAMEVATGRNQFYASFTQYNGVSKGWWDAVDLAVESERDDVQKYTARRLTKIYENQFRRELRGIVRALQGKDGGFLGNARLRSFLRLAGGVALGVGTFIATVVYQAVDDDDGGGDGEIQ